MAALTWARALAAAGLVFAPHPTVILGGHVQGTDTIQAARRARRSSRRGDEKLPSALDYLARRSRDDRGRAGLDREAGDFDVLLELLGTAGLGGALSSSPGDGVERGGPDGVTLFAPRDGAFGNLAEDLGYGGEREDEEAVFDFLAGVLTAYAGQKDVKVEAIIADILLYHIGDGALTVDDLRRKGRVTSLHEREKIKVVMARRAHGRRRTKLISCGSNAILHKRRTDIRASNGILHVIKDVLLPMPFSDLESSGKVAGINGTKTRSPTESLEGRPAAAPTARKEEPKPAPAPTSAAASPTAPAAAAAPAAPCVPTTGPCISTEAEFRDVTFGGQLAPNDVISICGTADDGNRDSWTFQMTTSTIIAQNNVTLCCAGPRRCRIRARQSERGLPFDRILVVTGESFTVRDISFFFGVGGRSMVALTGDDSVGGAGGGNLAIVAGGSHLISDCRFGGGFGGAPLPDDPAEFHRGIGGNLYVSARGGEVTLIRTTIERGVAQLGGGVSIAGASRVVLEDSVVRGNKGSGLFTTSGFISDPAQTIEFRGSTFHLNQGNYGGGFLATAIGALPTLSIKDCIFEENKAYNGGAGAVFPDLGKFASLRFANNSGKGNTAEAAPPEVLAEDVCGGLLLATIEPGRPEYSYDCIEDMTEFVEVSES